LSPDESFRHDVRAWLDEHCPAGLREGRGRSVPVPLGGRSGPEVGSDAERWLTAMADRGWTVPEWPAEYGGGGLDRARATVLSEELLRIQARPPLARLNAGIQMIGPLLLEHGTEEQCQRFLPPIARGEVRWCQGYSEPTAGSDLASLRTRAVHTDAGYLVNGHKIWSSYAHVSDWMFCLVRTDTAHKQAGISFLLIDLDGPGITVEPITLLSGRSDFCEVFLTDVQVPADNLVGREGEGWTIAKRLLHHERSMLGSAAGGLSGGTSSGSLGLVELVRRRLLSLEADGHLAAAGILRDRYAAHAVRVRALKATARRYGDEGRRDAATPSVLKLASTELNMQREDLSADAAGWDGLVWDDGPDGIVAPELHGRSRAWLRSRANSIEGGTSEIQLNIIAKHALRLPERETP
jgi:alkylation response protein AidB-like acyl-CoA dehydrogenase